MMKTSDLKKENLGIGMETEFKYLIEYENGDFAGFTSTGYSDKDIYLWRSGTNWKIAEFETLNDAKDVVEATNRFQKKNKYPIAKFKIKRKLKNEN